MTNLLERGWFQGGHSAMSAIHGQSYRAAWVACLTRYMLHARHGGSLLTVHLQVTRRTLTVTSAEFLTEQSQVAVVGRVGSYKYSQKSR